MRLSVYGATGDAWCITRVAPARNQRPMRLASDQITLTQTNEWDVTPGG